MLVVLGEDDGEREGEGNCGEGDAGGTARKRDPVRGMRMPVGD